MGKTVRQEMEARRLYVTFEKSAPIDPAVHFREASQAGWDDLAGRDLGNAEDLSAAYMNAAHAMQHVRQASFAQIEQGFKVDDEMDHAMLLTSLAAGTVTMAMFLHLQRAPWAGNGAATLLRSAVEALASAAALLAGGDRFRARWFKERGRIDPEQALPFLFELLRMRRPDVSSPKAVYSWLSRCVHWDLPWIQRRGGAPTQEDVYCAIAYVSWACMVLAEVSTGYENLAAWPERWSDPLPWVRDSAGT